MSDLPHQEPSEEELLNIIVRNWDEAHARAERIDAWIQEISERLSLVTNAVVHQKKARVLTWSAAVLAGIAVVLSLVIVWRNIQVGDSRAVKQEAQIESLQDQLAGALAAVQKGTAEVEKARAADAKAVECLTLFDNAVEAAANEISVVIATTVPGTDRDKALGNKVQLLKDAQKARTAFRANPTEECPLK